MLFGCAPRIDFDGVQELYKDGVPHTDAAGRIRTEYAAGESFFPLALYHALVGAHYGRSWGLEAAAAAGFNAVHPWEGQPLDPFLDAAQSLRLQTIVHYPDDATIVREAGRKRVLAWYLDEEPTYLYAEAEQADRLAAADRRLAEVRALDPDRAAIVLDGPLKAGYGRHWRRWNALTPVSAHFNYPVTVADLYPAGPPARVAETVVAARRLTGERAPIWLALQAFGGADRGWRMPNPHEYRAMAYSAVIHGATGLIVFALDSFVTRDDRILGASPDPLADYGETPDFNDDGKPRLIASDAELGESRRLWREVARVNAEMARLAPALLRPTEVLAYRIRTATLGRSPVDGKVSTLLKPFGAGHAFFIVNLGPAPVDIAVSFALPVSMQEPLVDGQNEALVDEGALFASLDGYGVQVLKLRFIPPSETTIAVHDLPATE